MSLWPLVKLADVAKFSSGGTPSKAKAEFWNGDIPWISPKDMKSNRVIDAEDKITREAIKQSAAKVVGPESVLAVVRSGILVHTFPVATIGRNVSFNQDIKAITPKNGALLPAYLFWVLKGREAEILSIGVKKGATVHSVSSGFLEGLSFPLPPLDEQRRIARLLDRAADVRHRADTARAKARAIIPALFLDTFGDPAINPRGWREVTFGEVAAISYGSAAKLDSALKSSSGQRIVTISNVLIDGSIDHNVERFYPATQVEITKYSIQTDDLLFNWRNGSADHVGKTAIVPKEFDGSLHVSFLLKIRPNTEYLQSRFAWALLNILRSHGYFKANAREQINRKFNASELGQLKFFLPPKRLQIEFAERVQRLEALAHHLDGAASKAAAMAAGLSSAAFG